MRAEEGGESIEELAEDAANAQEEVEHATDEPAPRAGPPAEPAHRNG